MDYYQDYLNQLYDIFCKKFNTDELDTLCFRTGIHFDEFVGTNFTAKVRELLKYLDRHRQMIVAMVNQGKQDRSDLEWPSVTLIQQKAYTCERNGAIEEAIKIWENIRDLDSTATAEIQRLREKLLKSKVMEPSPSKVFDVTAPSAELLNYKFLADNLKRGNIVVFLGAEVPALFESNLRSPQQVVSSLAQTVNYPEVSASFAEVCEYWQAVGGGSRNTLCEQLQELVTSGDNSVSIPLYELLATIGQPLVVVSTCMSHWLEQAFKQQGKKFVVLSHANVNDEVNTLCLEYSDKVETEASCFHSEEELSSLNLIERGYSLIYKIRGSFQTADSLLLTEADYFTFAKKRDQWIPNYVVKQLNRRGFWLFGHNPREWENYLILESLFEKRRGRERPLAFQVTPHPFATAYWEAKGIKQYVINFHDFVANLQRAIEK